MSVIVPPAAPRGVPDLAPWLVLVAVGIAWGATTPISRQIMLEDPHPVGIAFWQTVVLATVFTAAMLLRGERVPLSRRSLGFFAICGLLGTALPHSLSFEAARHLPAGVITMVISLVPMATLLLAVPMGIERAEPRRLGGLALGVAAILLITLPETSLPDPALAAWVVLPVLVALSYAAENVVLARLRPPRMTGVVLMCGLSWAALALLAPWVLLGGAWEPPPGPDMAGLRLVGMAALHVGAYLGFVWLIATAGPVFAAQVGYVVTISGNALAMAFLGERLTPWLWAALALILAGLALVRPRRRCGL